jgi:hypothetical protein
MSQFPIGVETVFIFLPDQPSIVSDAVLINSLHFQIIDRTVAFISASPRIRGIRREWQFRPRGAEPFGKEIGGRASDNSISNTSLHVSQ